MPTKKKRVQIIPDNLPALTQPEETCPSLFTGTTLAKKDPGKYGRVVQKLAEGMSMNRIAKVEKLSPGTVAAIAKREHKSVDAVQTLTAGLTSYASQACLERIIEKLDADEIPAGVLPICFGILRDKERGDLGQAQTVIEHKQTLTIDQVKRELDQMKRNAEDAG
jgi:transposase